MVAFMIQPDPSGECCVDPCSRSGPCDPCGPTTTTTTTTTTILEPTTTTTTTTSTTSTTTTSTSTSSTTTTTAQNWQGCDGTEPGTVDLTITYQPSGTQETETYTKNADFCRYDNLNPGGTGQHITWSNTLNKWQVLNATTTLATNDDLIGEYTTTFGSHDYEVSL